MTTRTTKAAPKAKAAPVVITAPKGGTRTVAPRKGAIAEAIKGSGKSLMAVSRDHGLNPSQMRRLSLDQVARVDLVRAEAIAKALGKQVSDLFGEPTDKAKAIANGKAAAPATPAAPKAADTRKSRASRAAAKLAKDAEKAAQDAAAEAPQAGAPETPAE